MNSNFRKLIFDFFSLLFLSFGIYFSFCVKEPNGPMTGIWLTFCLFTFAFGRPEIAESISFLGNSIKLRETIKKAKNATNEAKNATNELKHLTAIFSNVILESIQSSGRWGGFTEEKRLEAFNRIDTMLKAFGFTRQEIERIEYPWHHWTEIDYINNILVRGNVNHPIIPEDKKDEWKKKKDELGNQFFLLQPDDLRNLFREFNAYTEEIEKLIDDFEYYKKNKQHRDPQRWKQRDHWFK